MSRLSATEKPMTIKRARDDGLLIEVIPIKDIDTGYLVRDRLVQDEDEMASLISSLRARGQQMPIEVTRLTSGDAKTPYGLISGWRRLTALQQLHASTKDPQYATVRALVIKPESAQDAYRSMIEENEIRVNLSYYERARIALRSVHEGVFRDHKAALRGLFSSSTRSKRSKIGTFITLVHNFDGVLHHPTAISEKLGLSLARELIRDPGFGAAVSDRLRKLASRTAPEEMQILANAVARARENQTDEPKAPQSSPAVRSSSVASETVSGVKLRFDPDKATLNLTGGAVDAAFVEELKAWLRSR